MAFIRAARLRCTKYYMKRRYVHTSRFIHPICTYLHTHTWTSCLRAELCSNSSSYPSVPQLFRSCHVLQELPPPQQCYIPQQAAFLCMYVAYKAQFHQLCSMGWDRKGKKSLAWRNMGIPETNFALFICNYYNRIN